MSDLLHIGKNPIDTAEALLDILRDLTRHPMKLLHAGHLADHTALYELRCTEQTVGGASDGEACTDNLIPDMRFTLGQFIGGAYMAIQLIKLRHEQLDHAVLKAWEEWNSLYGGGNPPEHEQAMQNFVVALYSLELPV